MHAQAFAVYELAEFHRATGEPPGLQLAQDLFDRIEQHSFDPICGGNLEYCSRGWGTLDDMRLSGKDLNTPQDGLRSAASVQQRLELIRRNRTLTNFD